MFEGLGVVAEDEAVADADPMPFAHHRAAGFQRRHAARLDGGRILLVEVGTRRGQSVHQLGDVRPQIGPGDRRSHAGRYEGRRDDLVEPTDGVADDDAKQAAARAEAEMLEEMLAEDDDEYIQRISAVKVADVDLGRVSEASSESPQTADEQESDT